MRTVYQQLTLDNMIKKFRHKGLSELFETSKTSKIDKRMHKRTLRRQDPLDAATCPEDMDLPGFDFHALEGKPQQYTVPVNGPWCVVFEFEDGHAYAVDFKNYH